jgi:hypothetical protein
LRWIAQVLVAGAHQAGVSWALKLETSSRSRDIKPTTAKLPRKLAEFAAIVTQVTYGTVIQARV